LDEAEWQARVQRVGAIAATHAVAVDHDGRFPAEAVNAMRAEGLLGAWIPRTLGGLGASLTQITFACEALGQQCASSAMIFAMHQIEVAALTRHAGESRRLRAYLRTAAFGQRLIASATSEVGVGGDVRSSKCAVEPTDRGFALEKHAPVISYGLEADDILVTARRAADARPGDQVAVLVSREDYTLEQTSRWNALGFRGTCSHGFVLRVAAIDPDAILPVEFATICAETMVPVSHLLWSSLWLGIATDAVRRARQAVRADAKRQGATGANGSARLADLVARLHQLRATVREATQDYASRMETPDALQTMAYAIRINNLKITASEALVDIVQSAMHVAGIAGYRLDSPVSLGRSLRDAFGAVVMINNDRILAANASMLLASRED
jgi:acyl-CoA dehydrogenase